MVQTILFTSETIRPLIWYRKRVKKVRMKIINNLVSLFRNCNVCNNAKIKRIQVRKNKELVRYTRDRKLKPIH